MKTIAKMLMCMACLALLTNCEKDSEKILSETSYTLKSFEAGFIVYDHSGENNVTKSKGCHKTWKGEGESTTLGLFSITINLLCDMDNLSFYNLVGIFNTADGSKLFFRIDKGVIQYNQNKECPIYHYTINELATIYGGTGRFAGATGSFRPNAQIHNAKSSKWFAKFTCEGEIKLQMTNHIETDPLIPETLPQAKKNN